MLTTLNHEAEVFASTGPDNASCIHDGDGKHIVCSVDNLDVTFNIYKFVSCHLLAAVLGFRITCSKHADAWARFLLWPASGRQFRSR